MEAKKLVPTIVGYAVGLGLLYLTVRIVSSAWKGGQK
jgi:hypothetical protein